VFARARQTDIQNETTRELAAGVSHNRYVGISPIAFIVSGHLEEQRVGDRIDDRHAVYFGHRRTFRRTDDLLLPRAGYLASAELGGSPPGLATQEFLRFVASVSLLMPVGRYVGDLLIRGQVGSVVAETRQGIPTTFLFRTGGDQTVRGYEFESLGIQQGDAIVGGRRLAVGSMEYTHWIGENWGAAAFVDIGNAWDEGLSFDPALGYGVGGRFRTPIGPIRADLAYGEKTGQFRIHFSVGYTF
jgi:translocation and assembly module TamA